MALPGLLQIEREDTGGSFSSKLLSAGPGLWSVASSWMRKSRVRSTLVDGVRGKLFAGPRVALRGRSSKSLMRCMRYAATVATLSNATRSTASSRVRNPRSCLNWSEKWPTCLNLDENAAG